MEWSQCSNFFFFPLTLMLSIKPWSPGGLFIVQKMAKTLPYTCLSRVK